MNGTSAGIGLLCGRGTIGGGRRRWGGLGWLGGRLVRDGEGGGWEYRGGGLGHGIWPGELFLPLRLRAGLLL
jgi:hypothetical protein